jgi:membrane protease YdiL (CAAX protease family)
MSQYLDGARNGKNEWWRYLSAVCLILVMWQVLGAMPTLGLYLALSLDNDPETTLSASGPVGVSTTVSFIVLMLASLFFLTGIWIAVRGIHARPLRSLITPAGRLDWKRLFQGFLVWGSIASLTSLLEAFLYPGRYQLTLDLPRFIPFVFIALLLVPIQTSTEELFFRGYLLQGFGLRLRSPWLLSLLSGVFFGLPHLLNPEASSNYFLMGLYYFAIGAVLAYMTLRDGRLELALGMHAANNLFSTLLANYAVTVLPSPSLFTIQELDPVFSVIAALVGLGIFVWIFLGPLARRQETGSKNVTA